MEVTPKDIFDWKRFAILNRRNMGLVVVLALLGGILLSVLLYLQGNVFGGAETYRSAFLYSIIFDRDQVDNIHDYYNDYTWNDVLDSDRIAGVAAVTLSDFTKEEIGKATTVPTMSDIRFIWVYADADNPEDAVRIQEAVAGALLQFGEDTEGFAGIEIWDKRDVETVEEPFFWGRTIAAGFVICLLLGVFPVLYQNAMDDSVYSEEDVQRFFGKPAAGTLFSQNRAGLKTEDAEFAAESLTKNLDVLLDGKEVVYVLRTYADMNADTDEQDWKTLLPNKEVHVVKDAEEVKKEAGLVWAVPFGGRDGKRLEREWKNLQIRRFAVDAIVIVGADGTFYQLYYGKGKNRK